MLRQSDFQSLFIWLTKWFNLLRYWRPLCRYTTDLRSKALFNFNFRSVSTYCHARLRRTLTIGPVLWHFGTWCDLHNFTPLFLIPVTWLYHDYTAFFIIFMNVIIKTFNRPSLSNEANCVVYLFIHHYRNAIFFGFDHNIVRYDALTFHIETIPNQNTNEFLFCFCNFVRQRSCLCAECCWNTIWWR